MAAAHAVILAMLGLRAPQIALASMDPPGAVEVLFLPRPSPAPERAPTVTPARPRLAFAVPSEAVQPSPLAPTNAPGSPGAQSEAEALAALSMALRRGQRGCANRARLNPEARAACDERLGDVAADAAALDLALPPGKQASLEEVAAFKRRWKAYKECENGPACEALYPGHRAALRNIFGP